MTERKADLEGLVNEPRETLDVEIKTWLDLSDNDHRAIVAKEIIALANHGGGFVVMGFEEASDSFFSPALPRPSSLQMWSQDSVQGVVAKYVDPSVQCHVEFVAPRGSVDQHPIIIVPGGHRVPVRAKKGSPDNKSLVAHRIYVRRPGPNSQEPQTAEEWDRLFERCLQNRKAELLTAYRSIMAGELPTSQRTATTPRDRLLSFIDQGQGRWSELIESLPKDAPPRLEYGHYDIGFFIDADFEQPSLSDMRDIVSSAVRNHSGWPPFININRPPYTPKPVDGTVECRIGPDTDGSFKVPARHAFWRVSPEGLLFTRQGYREDGSFEGVVAGKCFDITNTTWRLGEAILEAVYIARELGASDANLVSYACWTGLVGRQLVSIGNPNRHLTNRYCASQDTYETTQTASVATLPDSLPEMVDTMLTPLYELFDFFPLPKRLVEQELNSLQSGNF